MSALERIIRRLVTTTLPLSLLGCAGEDPCAAPRPIQLPANPSCLATITCNCWAEKAVEICGEFPRLVEGVSECRLTCGRGEFTRCWRISTDGGASQVGCGNFVDCTGRRPAGLLPGKGVRADPLGTWLARAAHLEAASVSAFDQLQTDLRALGAPIALASEAARAARDEIRHARAMTTLARLHGAGVPPVEIAPPPVRTFEDIAVENAVEGCTRELFGSAVGIWQAETALDRRIGRTMRAIAADELRHAALALEIARWANRQLDDPARARVEAARRTARWEVERQAVSPAPPELVVAAGLPPPNAAATLARGIAAAIPV